MSQILLLKNGLYILLVRRSICIIRNRRGLSQKETAAQLGVPQSTYRDWEYGKRIVVEHYVDLSHVFEVSLAELLTGKKTEISEILLRLTELEGLVRTIRIAVASL